MTTTYYYTESEVFRLVRLFDLRKLDREEWTFETQIMIFTWYIMKYPKEDVVTMLRTAVKRYNEVVGIMNTNQRGYHETLTRFWIGLIKSYTKGKYYASVAEAINDLLNSDMGDHDFPLQFYSKKKLYSAEARLNWVEPDKKAFRVNLKELQAA